MFVKGTLLVVLSIASLGLAHAQASSGRDVLSIGCDKDTTVCTLEVNGDPVGQSECIGQTLKFDLKDDKNADASLMLLSAAFFAGKKIDFAVSSQCFDGEKNSKAATFDSFKVLN